MQRFLDRGGAWVVAQAFVLILVFGSPYLLPDAWLPWPLSMNAMRHGAGLAIGAVGLGMAIAAMVRLGPNLTPLPKPLPSGTLVHQGIYRWVRHPIYGGIVLLGFASALRDPSLVPLAGAFAGALFFDRKAAFEETWLIESFPEYIDYRERTRKLIPLVY